MLMDEEYLEDLKDGIQFEMDMSERSQEDMREELFSKVKEKISFLIESGQFDDVNEIMDTTVELDNYIKRGGTKKVE
jgi:hypothetical protein